MIVRSAKLTFLLAGADSLKDKRQICRSMIDKAKRKFNAAIAEVDAQDKIGTLVIGVALVSGEAAHAAEMLESLIRHLENEPEAEALVIERD